MIPTYSYIIEKFDYYNYLCFGGELQRPPIRFNNRYRSMGRTLGHRGRDGQGKVHWSDLSIEISVRYDLPEEEYIDTLVHEMIHYYIMSHDMEDSSPHGALFCRMMDEISRKHGIKISLKFVPQEEEMIKTRTGRWRYVCVAEMDDDRMAMTVVARNKVFRFWDLIPNMRGIRAVRWYASDRQIFDRFRTVVTPRLAYVDADKVYDYLTGAQELERVGNVIRMKPTE